MTDDVFLSKENDEACFCVENWPGVPRLRAE